MSSVRKRLGEKVHQDLSKADADKLESFLAANPQEEGKLIVGVQSKQVGRETYHHLSESARKRVKFVVAKKKPPEGIPTINRRQPITFLDGMLKNS